jgi:hypothetical protein
LQTHATRDEFFKALEGLPESARLALMAQARHHARGHSGYSDGEDLFSEAVLRVANGARKWPVNVDLVTFMGNAMRSIVNGERGRVDMSTRRRVDLDDALSCPHTHEALGLARSAEDDAADAERARLGTAAARWARLMLIEDELALLVLDGMLRDLSKQEILRAHRMTDRVYRASMGRVASALHRLGKEMQS